jgi:hypothetical protein
MSALCLRAWPAIEYDFCDTTPDFKVVVTTITQRDFLVPFPILAGSPMNILKSLSLVVRALMLIGLVVILTAVCIVVAAHWALKDQFNTKAGDDIEGVLRTLVLTYADNYKDTKVKLDGNGIIARVDASGFPTFSSHDVVDKAAAMAGGVATIFQWDEASKRRIIPVSLMSGAARPIRARPYCSAANTTPPISPSLMRRARPSAFSLSARRSKSTTPCSQPASSA